MSELNKQWLVDRLCNLAEGCGRSKRESHGQDEVYYRAKEQAYKKAMELAEILTDSAQTANAQTANEPLTLGELREMTNPVFVSGYYPPEYHIGDNWYLIDRDEECVYRDDDCISFKKVVGCVYRRPPERSEHEQN